jgi:DNA-binding beta-propeller fold protein YncE
VTPIFVGPNKAGRPIKVGRGPESIVIAADGKTAYVTGEDGDAEGIVTPIRTATNMASKAIREGNTPADMAVTARSKILYVVNWVSQTVTQIGVATGRTGRPIRAGHGLWMIAISPDGKTAYVADFGFPRNAPGTPGSTVTPIRISTNTPEKPIKVGAYPIAIAMIPAREIRLAVPGQGSAPAPSRLASRRSTAPKPMPETPAAQYGGGQDQSCLRQAEIRPGWSASRPGADPGLYIAPEKWLRDLVTGQRETQQGGHFA